MNALVTGGAGFIGSHVADALLEKGCHVEIVDNLLTGQRENIPDKAVFHEIDIRDEKLNEIFKRGNFDMVFHLAAQMDIKNSVLNPAFDADANILGGINLLQAMKKNNVNKITFSSSCAVYGEQVSFPAAEDHQNFPDSPYGIGKLAFEKYLYFYHKEFGIKYTALRYANIFGPRQRGDGEGGVVAIFFRQLLSNKEAYILGDGNQTRDMTYVGDVVRANIMSIDYDKCGIFNVSTGIETTVNTLFETIKEIIDSKQERLHKPPREGETMRSVLDNSAIKSALNWQPQVDIKTGLKNTADYFRKKVLV